MIFKTLKTALAILIVSIISVRYSGLYSVYGIKPDLVLIILLRRSMSEAKPHISVIWSFSAGMLKDILSGDTIGISSLTYSIVCYYVSSYRRKSQYLPPYKRTLIYVYSVLFSSVLIYSVTLSGLSFFQNMFFTAFPSAIYTLVVSMLFQSIKPSK